MSENESSMTRDTTSKGIADNRTILRYKIWRKIGSGGLGLVYLGYDPLFKRRVVLKFIRMEYREDKEVKERFFREALALSTLNHPNIACFYGIEETESGLFLLLEYIAGESLEEHLKREGKIQYDTIIPIMIQLLSALSYAHSEGIVHRDIKPSNLIFTSDRKLKVSDFGLAHIDFESTLTKTGNIIGTPYYMSPEQVHGLPVDARSDIFSVGVILYEMLMGSKPFDGDTPLSVMYSIMNDIPDYDEFPSESYEKALLRVAAKAMLKSPQERYQTAEELASDVENIAESVDTKNNEMLLCVGLPDLAAVKTNGVHEEKGTMFSSRYLIVPFILLLMIMYYFWFGRSPLDTNPTSFLIQSNELRIFNKDQTELWRKEFPVDLESLRDLAPDQIQRYLKLDDIDSDGSNEVLIMPYPSGTGENQSVLYCFESDSQEKWRFLAGKSLSFGSDAERTRGIFSIKKFYTHDLDQDGRKEVIVQAQQKLYYPTQISLLNSEGEVRGEYWNSGYVYSILFKDINGDGIEEIIAGATNNEYKSAALIVLDPLYLIGSSPQLNEAFAAEELAPGAEMYYILLQRSDLAKRMDLSARIRVVEEVGSVVNAEVYETAPSGIQGSSVFQVLFSETFTVENVILKSQFVSVYRESFMKGFLQYDIQDLEYRRLLENQFKACTYWDGEKFVTEPTINLMWRNLKEAHFEKLS